MAITPPCVVVEKQGRELAQHGTALFPLACYDENLTCYCVPWHWHEDFEYILAAEGHVTVGAEKARIVLEQGQGIFINSGVLHAVEFAETGPSVLHSGVFHPRFAGGMDTVFWQKYAASLLAPGAPPYFLLDGSAAWHAEALECLEDVWSALKNEPADYENLARYRLTTALRLLSAHRPAVHTEPSPKDREAARRMKQMLRFIEEHYAEELTVADIAATASLSESACLRSFRQLLGTTPIQYVKQYRIEKAAQLLLATGLKAGEIGAECGFWDMSYFTKTFREMKNCTPTEYRRRFGKGSETPIKREI